MFSGIRDNVVSPQRDVSRVRFSIYPIFFILWSVATYVMYVMFVIGTVFSVTKGRKKSELVTLLLYIALQKYLTHLTMRQRALRGYKKFCMNPSRTQVMTLYFFFAISLSVSTFRKKLFTEATWD